MDKAACVRTRHKVQASVGGALQRAAGDVGHRLQPRWAGTLLRTQCCN